MVGRPLGWLVDWLIAWSVGQSLVVSQSHQRINDCLKLSTYEDHICPTIQKKKESEHIIQHEPRVIIVFTGVRH
jgi:hypothetical protein